MVRSSCLLIHGTRLLVLRRSARGPARPREGRGVALRVSRRPGATQWLPWGRGEHTLEPWRALGGPGVDLQKRGRIPKKCCIFESQLRDRSQMVRLTKILLVMEKSLGTGSYMLRDDISTVFRNISDGDSHHFR